MLNTGPGEPSAPILSTAIHWDGAQRVSSVANSTFDNFILKSNKKPLAPPREPESGLPQITILMCTYNGEHFLAEQLESFNYQTHTSWNLIVSDDGSRDNTLNILKCHQQKLDKDRLKIVPGPQQNFVRNFLSLCCRVDIEADFYAWADQDDIWNEDKLQVASNWLSTIPKQLPALYCSRTQLIDESNNLIGFSPKFSRPPSFANALVQNIGGGNTMVFNHTAKLLLQEAGDKLDIPTHDWWAYQLITGAGGVIHYDESPHLLYRQHSSNLIGSNSGWLARFQRLRGTLRGDFKAWSRKNIEALDSVRHLLTLENQLILDNFKHACNQKSWNVVWSLRKAGVYRQTWLGNLSLILACLAKEGRR